MTPTENMKFDFPEIKPNCVDWQQWDGLSWVLSKDWSGRYDCDGKSFYIEIKRGFETDFGSIPKFYWFRVAPMGTSLVAFLVHDALYMGEFFDQKTDDIIMYNIQKWLGVGLTRRWACERAVRNFGHIVWNNHTPESIAEARKFVSVT